jgi:DNA-binding GntR family transcriptional regulator
MPADVSDTLPLLARPNINQRVYELLRERILSRRFVPGQRLDLPGLERQLGVSRTPLKDALHHLAAEGLIEIVPRSGTYVTDLTLEDILESFDVRRLLEVYAVELAAQRITESQLAEIRDLVRRLGELVMANDWSDIYQQHVELDRRLHELIVECAGNKQLKKLWQQVNAYVQIARIRYRRSSSKLNLAQQEHEAILSALEARDVALLKSLIARHLDRTKQLLQSDFSG